MTQPAVYAKSIVSGLIAEEVGAAMTQPAVYAKSIVSGLIAAVSFAIPCVDDGLVASEVLGILLAGLTGLGITYAVPNKDPLREHPDESVQD